MLDKIKILLYNFIVKMRTIPNLKEVIMKNYSRQREEIIKVIKEFSSHPTAEEVYMTVKAKDPAVSRSTVYRNLSVLVENKIINKISMLVGPDKYDGTIDFHNHAICTCCGKIFDFNYDFGYEKMKEIIQEQTGIEIINKGIALEGICNLCKNK